MTPLDGSPPLAPDPCCRHRRRPRPRRRPAVQPPCQHLTEVPVRMLRHFALCALVAVVARSFLVVHAQQLPPAVPPPSSSSPSPSQPPPSGFAPFPSLLTPNNATTAAAAGTNSTSRSSSDSVTNATLPLITIPRNATSLAINCTSSQDCAGLNTVCTAQGKCALARCGMPQFNATLLPCSLYNASFCTHWSSGRGVCSPQLPEGAACNPDLDSMPSAFRLDGQGARLPSLLLNATHLPNVNLSSPDTPRFLQFAVRDMQCLGLNHCSPTLRRCVRDPATMWLHDPNNREGKLSVWMALVVMVGGLVALAAWVALCTSGMIRCSRLYQRHPKMRWCVDRVCGGVCCCCFAACRKRAQRQPMLPIGLSKVSTQDKGKGAESVTSSAPGSQVDDHPEPMHPLAAASVQPAQVPFSPPLPPRPTHQQLAAMMNDTGPLAPQLSPLPPVSSSPLLPQFDLAKQLQPSPLSAAGPTRLSMLEPAIADGVLPPMMAPMSYPCPAPGPSTYLPPPPPPPLPAAVRHQPQPVYFSPLGQHVPVSSASTSTSSSSTPTHHPPPVVRPWNVGKP